MYVKCGTSINEFVHKGFFIGLMVVWLAFLARFHSLARAYQASFNALLSFLNHNSSQIPFYTAEVAENNTRIPQRGSSSGKKVNDFPNVNKNITDEEPRQSDSKRHNIKFDYF